MLLAACGGGDKKDPGSNITGPGGTPPIETRGDGTFSGQASGDLDMALSGQSVAIVDDSPAMGFAMGDGKTYTVIISRREATLPPVGTYALGDATNSDRMPPAYQFAAALILSSGQSTNPAETMIASKSGTLRITASSDTRIKGEFSASLRGIRQNPDGTQTPVAATVKGSFDAPVVHEHVQ
jgi:hypothetical protein